jgi:chorismate synthase
MGNKEMDEQREAKNGFTLGSPISLSVANQDQRPVD